MASVQKIMECPKCGENSFDVTTYSDGERLTFCYSCGFVHDIRLKVENHPEVGYKEIILGGYGVVTAFNGRSGYSRSLEKDEIPEITDDVFFASAIVNGKLTVLKCSDE